MAQQINKPSVIEWGAFKFVVMDAANDQNLHLYMKVMKELNVTDLCRACEPTYDTEEVRKAGIVPHDFEFKDGDPPPKAVIESWLNLITDRFKKQKADGYVAVHCIAGLGRAPVLVAIALIENGMNMVDAVQLIRKNRRGAINKKQLEYLETYVASNTGCCTMM